MKNKIIFKMIINKNKLLIHKNLMNFMNNYIINLKIQKKKLEKYQKQILILKKLKIKNNQQKIFLVVILKNKKIKLNKILIY